MFINITIEFDNKQYDLSLDNRQRIHIAVEILMKYLKVPTLPVTFYRSKMQVLNNFKNKIAQFMFDPSDITAVVGRSSYSQISAMQLDVNQAIAYMYMDSLLKEFHAGQNEVSSIFQNDEDDMIALGKVKLHNFTEALELGDIPRVPFNPEELDFEPYTEDVKGIGEDMSQEYLDSYAKAKEDYKIIEGELVELADAITDQSDEWQIALTDWRTSVLSEVAQIQTYRSSMEEWHQLAVLWNTENRNWHNGLNSYKNSADQWYSNASNWANIAVAWKQSAAGWENDAAEWKSTALEKAHSYNENIVKLAQYYDDLADWQSNLQEYAQSPSGDAPEFTSSGELPDTIDTTSFESAVLTSLPPMNIANVPMVQENLPPAFTAEELAAMPELEEYAILSVPLKPQELTDALLQIKEKAAVYDPEQYLTPEVKRRIDYFVEQYSNNLVRLQGDMELNQDKNIGLLQEAYYEYNNYVFELRMQALETHDEEQENLKTGLGIFYTAKMQTSEENRALLGSFANKLPYSRRGTSVNGEIVEFCIAPLRFTHINIRPARTVDELGQHDLQKTTQAAMLYVFVLMCILVLVVMALYLNDKQKNTKKLRELTAAG